MNQPFTIPDHVPRELVFDFDIYGEPQADENVHLCWDTLHPNAPDIFYTPRNGGHWIVTRYDQIAAIVSDPEFFSARELQIPRVSNPPMLIPLTLDPPYNMPFRQALMPVFAPKSVNAMVPMIRHWAAKIIDEVVARGECDFTRDVAALFPVTVFMELMGLPLERLREFRSIADNYFNARSDAEFETSSTAIIGIFDELIEARRREPRDDLVSRLLNIDENGRPIRLDEVQSMCHLLFLGGMDTVTNVSAFAWRELARDTQTQARLANDASLIPKFVEEALRLFGVSSTSRLVLKDCERFGAPFHAGEMVTCLLPISGRDDRHHENPNRIDLDREHHEHLIFSTGPHLCVGHLLARAEIRVLAEEWVKRLPRFRIKAGTPQRYRLGTVLAQLTLPLEWDR